MWNYIWLENKLIFSLCSVISFKMMWNCCAKNWWKFERKTNSHEFSSEFLLAFHTVLVDLIACSLFSYENCDIMLPTVVIGFCGEKKIFHRRNFNFSKASIYLSSKLNVFSGKTRQGLRNSGKISFCPFRRDVVKHDTWNMNVRWETW